LYADTPATSSAAATTSPAVGRRPSAHRLIGHRAPPVSPVSVPRPLDDPLHHTATCRSGGRNGARRAGPTVLRNRASSGLRPAPRSRLCRATPRTTLELFSVDDRRRRDQLTAIPRNAIDRTAFSVCQVRAKSSI